jgi:hypothetical protein
VNQRQGKGAVRQSHGFLGGGEERRARTAAGVRQSLFLVAGEDSTFDLLCELGHVAYHL